MHSPQEKLERGICVLTTVDNRVPYKLIHALKPLQCTTSNMTCSDNKGNCSLHMIFAVRQLLTFAIVNG